MRLVNGRRAAVMGSAVGAMALVVALGGPATAVSASTDAANPATSQLWTPTSVPIPANHETPSSDYVEAVTCPAPGFCAAVGTSATSGTIKNTSDYTLPFGDVYSAGKWTVATLSLPAGALTGAGANAQLRAVSCLAPGSCVAVGWYVDSSDRYAPLVETYAAGNWTAASAPLPANTGTGTNGWSELSGVSCAGAPTCVAVGAYRETTGRTAALVETLSGGTWTPAEAPEPAGAGTGAMQTGGLDTVTCLSATSCAAAGDYEDSTGVYWTLFETLSGSTWTPHQGQAGPGGAAGTKQYIRIEGITCPAPGNCVAVGTYDGATKTTEFSLIDTLANGTWTAEKGPQPSNDAATTKDYEGLEAVACPAAGSCIAVGFYYTDQGQQQGMIQTLANGTWTVQSAPVPSNVYTGKFETSQLDGLSCSAPGSCVAVGGYPVQTTKTTATTGEFGLIDTLSGTTWTASAAPQPSVTHGGHQGAFLGSVSCVGGSCAAGGTYRDSTGNEIAMTEVMGQNPSGYFEAASDGGIFAFTVPFHGSMGGKPLNAPIVTAAADPLTGGYYEVASDGGMFAFTAPFHGSMGGKPLNAPIVSMAFDTRTGGYYEVASDGGIFAFTAPFHGSMGGKPLNEPIVGMAFDPSTGGYWLVASDGGLFAFTAPFKGSMGGKPLVKPIVGMTYDTLTGGYYEVASDGGLFAFTAPFHGSMGGKPLNEPVVAMAFDYGTGGYWEVASDGGLFSFTAPFDGSMGGKPLNEPIVTMALG
jgi:hypothetical protein